MLIDRTKRKMMNFKSNKYGQILKLHNSDHHDDCVESIEGIISRTQEESKYLTSQDAYIYTYIMTADEQAQCKFPPKISEKDVKIIEPDDYPEAIRAMCEWVFKDKFDFTKWGAPKKFFDELSESVEQYIFEWNEYVKFASSDKTEFN